ncbi:phosphoadenosine phosphosulfate sulfurtransferase [Synergistales bacterium]|nr:phosphoadenosine phosphosulfate sulfurtransferase [Synergistales bacterium]
MPPKVYLQQNVYDAAQDRLKYVFDEFDNIIVAFSGGKDSGLLLNLVVDYAAKHGIKKRIGLFHQDFEAQFQLTTDFVYETFEKHADKMDCYWSCIPMAVRTAVGNTEAWWYPWDDQHPELWVRDMPQKPYVYNISNHPMGEMYQYRMDYHSHARAFNQWYHQTHGGERTITLLGIRTNESLNRFYSVTNKVHDYRGRKWITDEGNGVYSASPLYDWTVEDVWHCNAVNGYEYNRLYDMFYKAGVPLSKMRVASPFNDEAANTINLYRVLDAPMWAKIVGRVKGANFASIYGGTKAMGWHKIQLPQGHTWRSYVKFLLSTLPEETRNRYVEKFTTSLKFWRKQGGCFSDDIISEIESCGYDIARNGESKQSKNSKTKIVFHGNIPDDTDDVKSTRDIPSWKRMAIVILKNDHTCKTMGFGMTKQQNDRRKEIVKKYATL